MEMVRKETKINFKSSGRQKKQHQMKCWNLPYVIAKKSDAIQINAHVFTSTCSALISATVKAVPM